MEIENSIYFSIEDLKKGLKISSLDPQKTMIQVFSGFVLEDEVKQIWSIFKKKNPQISFIGATTAGEIFEGEAYEKSIVVSIVKFNDIVVKEGYFLKENDFETGKEIASSLFDEDTKAAIIFVDGVGTNANDIIDGITSINASVPIAGGLAGDNGYLKRTFVFDKNGVYDRGAVVLSLKGKKLNIFNRYRLNWQPIGKVMKVTKADGNRLYEIDGISAKEIYRKYLGDKIADNLPYSATEFPLLKIEEDGTNVCRACSAVFDDGSLLTIGNLKEGDKVRLSFANVDLILNSVEDGIKELEAVKPEIIFIYSCVSRKIFLQSEISKELEPFNSVAPNVGFFTYGEIFHHSNKNSLLSMSLTIFAIGENEKPVKKIKQVKNSKKENNFLSKDKHILVLEALTHLANTVIKELEEAKEQLKKQANIDYLTGVYNRRYFNEVAYDLINLAKREKKPISVIMLDIDKFKQINDTYGHSVGDEVIKRVAKVIVSNIRDSDIVARFGGEEFAVLLPFTDKDGALKVAQKIRESIEKERVKADGKDVSFTVSIGVAEVKDSIEEALNRADKALYTAKRTGRNKVVVY